MSNRKMLATVSKVYKNVNETMGRNYYNYEALKIPWGTPDKYEIIKKVGRGKYSEVFEGIDVVRNKKIIIKVLKPVRYKKIMREVKILENLNKGENIVKLLDTIKTPETGVLSFIFDNIGGNDMKAVSPKFTLNDIRYYLYKLCQALDYCHSMGIIHRDVKPRNIMVNHEKKQLKLIDWGLAEFYHPETEYNVRVATRNYKAPELLVDYRYYDYSLDMWSVGCVLAGLIFKRDPFFRASSNVDMLHKVTRILGSKELEEYVQKYRAFNVKETTAFINKNFEKKTWDYFVREDNKHLVTKDALKLLDQLMIYDHQKRLTAAQAMEDPFFDPIRNLVSINGRKSSNHKELPKRLAV